MVVVRLALALRARVAVGEDVADLADGHDGAAGLGATVEDVAVGRRDGEVLPVGRALERAAALADEGAGDDAADHQRIDDTAADAAEVVEPLQSEMRLVRGDLQHAVDRGVEDRLAGADALLAEILDDRRSRSVTIAEDAGQSALADDRSADLGRKARLRVREVAPFERDGATGDLPMAGWRVLALGCLGRSAGDSARGLRREAGRELPRGGKTRGAEPERIEVRQRQRSLPETSPVAAPRGAGGRDMAERVRSRVAIGCRIRRSADAEAVEHDDDGARHATAIPPRSARLRAQRRRRAALSCSRSAGWRRCPRRRRPPPPCRPSSRSGSSPAPGRPGDRG